MSLVKFAQKEIGTSQEAVMEKAENNVLYKKAVAQATAEAFLEELVEYSTGGSMEKTAAVSTKVIKDWLRNESREMAANVPLGAGVASKTKALLRDYVRGVFGLDAKALIRSKGYAKSHKAAGVPSTVNVNAGVFDDLASARANRPHVAAGSGPIPGTEFLGSASDHLASIKAALANTKGAVPTPGEISTMNELARLANPYATLAGKGTTTVGALGLGAYGANKLIGNSSIMPIVEDDENDWNEMLRMGLGGAAVGAGANALYDYTTNDNTDAASLLHAALTGGAAGGAAGTLGGALSEYGDEYTKTTI